MSYSIRSFLLALHIDVVLLCVVDRWLSVHGGGIYSSLATSPSPTPTDAYAIDSSRLAYDPEHLLLFRQAVLDKNETRMIQLVQQKTDIVEEDYSILHYCVSMDHVEYLRIYLWHTTEVELNPRTDRGETPLILALQGGTDEVILMLLECDGLDVHAQDKDGWTVLMHAAKHVSPQIFKLLLLYPTNIPFHVNHMSRFGYDALLVLLEKAVEIEKLNLFLEYAAGTLEIPEGATEVLVDKIIANEKRIY